MAVIAQPGIVVPENYEALNVGVGNYALKGTVDTAIFRAGMYGSADAAAIRARRKFTLTTMVEGVATAGMTVQAYLRGVGVIWQGVSGADGVCNIVVGDIPKIDVIVINPVAPPEYNRMLRRDCVTEPYVGPLP